MRVKDMPTNLPRVMVSLSQELLKKLDDYRRKQQKIPSRSETVRDVLKKALDKELK